MRARAARAQVLLAALLRPGAESKLRRLWNLGHWWLGRAALVAALGNLFLGLRLGGEGLLAFLVLAALVAAWLLAGATKDLVDYLRLPPPGEEELGKKTFQDRMVEARARAQNPHTLTPPAAPAGALGCRCARGARPRARAACAAARPAAARRE
jgi:hypothetical protein